MYISRQLIENLSPNNKQINPLTINKSTPFFHSCGEKKKLALELELPQIYVLSIKFMFSRSTGNALSLAKKISWPCQAKALGLLLDNPRLKDEAPNLKCFMLLAWQWFGPRL